MSIPKRGHKTDAGIDLTAMTVEQKRPDIFFFDTGISIRISTGYYVEIVPRSSIIKTDFLFANSVGIIDPDYRGELRIILQNNGAEPVSFARGDRIAQLGFHRFSAPEVIEASELGDTVRGEDGFGSTGIE